MTEAHASVGKRCRHCEAPLGARAEGGLCGGCGDVVALELASLFETVGPLEGVGTRLQVEDVRNSLGVLYASTFLGTDTARIAEFLRLPRVTVGQYGMRFRAARIWGNGVAKGPWSSTQRYSLAWGRLIFMDALVGAGLVVRGKDRWDFLDEGSGERAA